MATQSSLRHSLTPTDARLVDEVCNRFEATWKDGAKPRLEEYLGEACPAIRLWLLEELLRLDCHYRTRLGETPSRDEYASRLPDDLAVIHDVFDRPTFRVGRVSTNQDRGDDASQTTIAGASEGSIVSGPDQRLAGTTTNRGDDSRYELLEEIGAGGIGRVYRARDHHLGRELAVKFLRTSHQEHPDILQRFVAEAQIGAQLQHTGIAPVYEMGYFADGSPYLAMKLVRGKTLAAMLSARRTPSDNHAGFLSVFEQVCQAIAYAHAREVIHRDLKPGNIMVGEFGEVQVMDWGLAKVLGGREFSGQKTAPNGETAAIRTHRTETDEFASLAGLIIGTPAYMPPEQSRGDVEAIDQRADVFALGAILCEILTGRPPYVADSTDEVCRMSRLGEVVEARQRLKNCGAELTLREMALHCLAANPFDRPADAGVVAHEIAAHLSSVEERLQQERLVAERQKLLVVEERKRRKLWMGLSAVAVLAISLAAIAGFIWQHNRAEYRQRLSLAAQQTEVDLSRAKSRILSGDIPGAWLDWNRASAREGMDALPELRAAREQLKQDLELTDELDKVRLLRSVSKFGAGFDFDAPLEGYEIAFAKYGLNVATENLELLAQRINESVVKGSLFAAIHDWAWICEIRSRQEEDQARRQPWQDQRNRLLQLAARVNSDRKLASIYDPANWDSRGKLDQFSKQLNTAEASPHLLITLGEMLSEDSREVLWRSGQSNHPNDFWMNLSLAVLLERKSKEVAIGFYRAALAIRPDAVSVHNNMGACFESLNRLDEAVSSYEKAITIDPEYWLAYVNLGNIWRNRGNLDEAIKKYQHAIHLHPDGRAWTNLAQAFYLKNERKEAIQAINEALRLSPNLAEAHKNLGMFLEAEGQIDKAIDSYHRAFALDPEIDSLRQNLSTLHYELANDSKNRKDFPSAIRHYRQSIEVQPTFVLAHHELADVLKRSGDLPAAVVSYREALRLEPKAAEVHYKLGLALQAQQDYGAAEASFRKALELNPNDSQAHRNLGVTLSKVRRHEEALPHFQEALKINPNYAAAHVSLGLALRELGQLRESLLQLQQGHDIGVTTESGRQSTVQWINEVSRLVELEEQLPRILAGEVQPTNAAESLAFANLCFHKQHYATSARIFAEAFVRHPDSATDSLSDHRQRAILAAALAGCGRSDDAKKLDETAKQGWRNQSLAWLREALTNCADTLERSADGAEKPRIRELVQQWRQCPQLSVVRDASELTQLSADDQMAWNEFWRDVKVVMLRLC